MGGFSCLAGGQQGWTREKRQSHSELSWPWVTRSPGCLFLPLSLSLHLGLYLFLSEAPNLPFIHPQPSHEIERFRLKGKVAERSREVCPCPNLGLRASCQNHGSILLFGLMSSVSYLPIHFPCPESFLGIPRVRKFGASGSYPNLVYSHAGFSPFPNSLHMLFHLPRMPFPLLLYPVKGLLAENEGDGLATVIFILSFSQREGIWEFLSSCYSTDL